MFTPQQIEEISFKKATFGGYDIQAVDEFLEPLTHLRSSAYGVCNDAAERYRKNRGCGSTYELFSPRIVCSCGNNI